MAGGLGPVEADGTIRTDAAGARDVRTGAPLSCDDTLHVGSAARRASAGRIDPDAAMDRYLSHLRFVNPWPGEAVSRER